MGQHSNPESRRVAYDLRASYTTGSTPRIVCMFCCFVVLTIAHQFMAIGQAPAFMERKNKKTDQEKNSIRDRLLSLLMYCKYCCVLGPQQCKQLSASPARRSSALPLERPQASTGAARVRRSASRPAYRARCRSSEERLPCVWHGHGERDRRGK